VQGSAAVQRMPECEEKREREGRWPPGCTSEATGNAQDIWPLHLLQRTGTLLCWAAGSGQMEGGGGFHIIPSHPPPIRSFGDGGLCLDYLQLTQLPGRETKRENWEENDTRQLSMEAWFQSFLFRAAQPSRGSLCVWARAAMILNEVVFAARRALSLHTI
jgi:hypothetical protein